MLLGRVIFLLGCDVQYPHPSSCALINISVCDTHNGEGRGTISGGGGQSGVIYDVIAEGSEKTMIKETDPKTSDNALKIRTRFEFIFFIIVISFFGKKVCFYIF
jgi:hypothetical protein